MSVLDEAKKILKRNSKITHAEELCWEQILTQT